MVAGGNGTVQEVFNPSYLNNMIWMLDVGCWMLNNRSYDQFKDGESFKNNDH